MNPTKLDILVDILKEAPDEVFIQPHNVPDPDAIASSLGLYYLLSRRGIQKLAIVYDQEIEKANSLRMLEMFKVPIIPASQAATLGAEDWAVLVDAQKGNANITDLPTDEVAAIDHHEYRGNMGYRFEDIRPEVGSCSAIIADWFFENNIEPPRTVATALLYGIFMDTDNLTRGASDLDINMFYRLYSLSDIDMIVELKGNEISIKDLELYAEAFKTVEIYDELGFLLLKSANDSLLGAAGDIVVSVSGVNIVIAYAIRDTGIKLSVRSTRDKVRANEMVRYLVEDYGVGGGHDNMAGGFIPKENLGSSRLIDTFIKHRAIAFYEKCNG
ncbi:MAG: DHH family phosphoesterase [Spirochaetaceae bacterium]|jgi:nanoRNase/pAp phosphatase (c-di-AMP/oligoRNAs hydrolase)|nr:DHH family phosphoesterase [Spirochaetaceae bacterium]